MWPLFKLYIFWNRSFHHMDNGDLWSHGIPTFSEDHQSKQPLDGRWRKNYNCTLLISTGNYLTDIVRKMDKYFSGMMNITFASCWCGLLTSSYLLISTFSKGRRQIDHYFVYLTLFSILCLLRVCCIVLSVKDLGITIGKALRTLQKIELGKNRDQKRDFKILSSMLQAQSKSTMTLFSSYKINPRIILGLFWTCCLSLAMILLLENIQLHSSVNNVKSDINETQSIILERISKSMKIFLCERQWYCN